MPENQDRHEEKQNLSPEPNTNGVLKVLLTGSSWRRNTRKGAADPDFDYPLTPGHAIRYHTQCASHLGI
jgi:hypothetical protein